MADLTIGKLLLDEAVPEEYRGSSILDKKGLNELLNKIADTKDSDLYNKVSTDLIRVGRKAAYRGNPSAFGPDHLRTTPSALVSRARLKRKLGNILRNPNLNRDQKRKEVVAAAQEEQEWLKNKVIEEARASGNPLARDIDIGARGKPGQLQSLIAGGELFTDAKGRIIPIPITRSLAEGRTLPQYWAGTYGGRTGLIGTKLAVADGGYANKRLIAAAHRLISVGEDDDEENADPNRGLPVDSEDDGSIGALLARETAGHPRNTIITPKVLEDIRNKGVKRMLVRSPLVGGPESGLWSRDIGVREEGILPTPGTNVGNPAVQAVAEKLTQGALGSKHSGGVAGAGPQGLALVNQLIEHPKNFQGGAAHAELDGKVQDIQEAPQGGWYIKVGGKQHYADIGLEPLVKVGDEVEAGDVLSKGLPNPETVIHHKGIGAGSKAFLHQFHKALKDSGINAERRNVELVVRGLVDHVEMTDADDEYVPGDVVSYRKMEKNWKPRESARPRRPSAALGQYLEKPVLHYTLGTQIKPSVLKDLEEFGIESVTTSPDPLPFKPLMIRASAIPQYDEDFMTRMLGGHQQKSLLKALHRGGHSDTASTSFVPALAQGKGFGDEWPKNIIKR